MANKFENGSYIIGQDSQNNYAILFEEPEGGFIYCADIKGGVEESDIHAMKEALNVKLETGLGPRELLDQKNELESICKVILNAITGEQGTLKERVDTSDKIIDGLRAAIKKATG